LLGSFLSSFFSFADKNSDFILKEKFKKKEKERKIRNNLKYKIWKRKGEKKYNPF
jgi:hypothetical protein